MGIAKSCGGKTVLQTPKGERIIMKSLLKALCAVTLVVVLFAAVSPVAASDGTAPQSPWWFRKILAAWRKSGENILNFDSLTVSDKDITHTTPLGKAIIKWFRDRLGK